MVHHFRFVYRGSFHRRKSAACPQFDLAELLAIPSAFPGVEEGGGGGRYSVEYSPIPINSVNVADPVPF